MSSPKFISCENGARINLEHVVCCWVIEYGSFFAVKANLIPGYIYRDSASEVIIKSDFKTKKAAEKFLAKLIKLPEQEIIDPLTLQVEVVRLKMTLRDLQSDISRIWTEIDLANTLREYEFDRYMEKQKAAESPAKPAKKKEVK